MKEQDKRKQQYREGSEISNDDVLKAKTALLVSESLYKTLIENLPQKVFFKDKDFKWVSINKNFAGDLKIKPEECFGKVDYDFFPKELADKYRADDRRIMESVKSEDLEENYIQDGEYRFVHTTKTAVRDEKGNVIGILGIFEDITERKRAEEELKRHRDHLEKLVEERTAELMQKSEILQRQAQEILEISTPVMQVWEGVLIAPLIGTLDSQRTQQFMERLLERIVETSSPVTLVDITGVPTIDTQTAQHLVDTISAVRLLGAQVILTGVRPAIAQTLVHLGVQLSDITTRSSLAAGLQVALNALNLQMGVRTKT